MSKHLLSEPELILLGLFEEVLKGVDPLLAVPAALPVRPHGPIVVVGAGKAAGAMAKALEQKWGRDIGGVVITRDGYASPTHSIEVLEAAHPVPDERGLTGTKKIMSLVRNAPNHALIVGLWSGGASSLFVQPIHGMSLDEKQSATRQLLTSGLPIQDINTVRKHLSLVKGGHLAELAGNTPMLNLFISDVVGDDLSVIASGPTVADPSTCRDATAIVSKAGLELPESVYEKLKNGKLETPKSIAESMENILISIPKTALASASAKAEELGLNVINLGDQFEGEARTLAITMAQRILQDVSAIKVPTVFLSGGEATVTFDQTGCGGPNLEFCLSLCLALDGYPRIWALACDTDGTDGISNSAGAIVAPDTLMRARHKGRDPERDLDRHNSESFFAAVDDLVMPGPAATNVNDFRAVLVLPAN